MKEFEDLKIQYRSSQFTFYNYLKNLIFKQNYYEKHRDVQFCPCNDNG